MTTITEDYVSFETAKLLKEKGFPQSTFRCHYLTDGNSYYKIFENRCGFGDYDIIAPTLAMAMKWLREVHNLVIQIEFIDFLEHGEVWLYSVIERKTIKQITDGDEDFTEHSYEQACESAIKYCLENLI